MAKQLRRYRFFDTTSDWRPFGSRDQGNEPADPEGEGEGEGEELLCRLMEGRDGNFMGHDGRGRSLRVKRGRDGALEVWRGAATGADEADPDVVGTAPGLSDTPATVDPARLAGRAGDALSRYQRNPIPERHIPGLAALQKRLNAFYADK